MKRLAVYVDGTWNVPHNNTNVWRLYVLTRVRGGGSEQLTYYHVGVGTGRRPTVGGEVRQSVSTRMYGAFGAGVNASVRSCYEWLVRNYDQGDEIYIFGFSRGAFIARSLAGFIERCGLLISGAPVSVREVFVRYRMQQIGGRVVKDPYLPDLEWPLHTDANLRRYSQQVTIRFLGVWDTVRYHDVPIGSIRGISRSENLFHVVQPVHTVQRMCHALALDEHRLAYRPELFFLPADRTGVPPVASIEQRWFTGAHSNVGGGYTNDSLAMLSLEWMQRKAAEAGLEFKRSVQLYGDELEGPVVDSFGRFIGGAYRLTHRGRRYWRKVDNAGATRNKGGIPSGSTGERIDASVFDRWRRDPAYRPLNLIDWGRSSGVDVSECTGDWIVNPPGPVEVYGRTES